VYQTSLWLQSFLWRLEGGDLSSSDDEDASRYLFMLIWE